MSVTEFWDLTPAETLAAIDAAVWRAEQAQQRDVALAWYVAGLQRTKRLPKLQSLLVGLTRAKPLTGEELARRRQEFERARANVDVAKLAEKLRGKAK